MIVRGQSEVKCETYKAQIHTCICKMLYAGMKQVAEGKNLYEPFSMVSYHKYLYRYM